VIESNQTDQNISVEEYIRNLQPLFIAIVFIIFIRFIINYIISSLVERGKITYVTKTVFMRIIDLVLLLTSISIVLHTFFAPYQLFIALFVIVIVLTILFYYELREFIAYVNLQLMRRVSGRLFEIHLPNQNKPVCGKIVTVNPLETVVEDLYGRRIHISNYLLVNSIFKDYVYSIVLKITLRGSDLNFLTSFEEIIKQIKEVKVNVFRIEERKISIEEISSDKCVFKIVATPIVTPIRTSDLMELIKQLTNKFMKYNPVIEIVESM